MKELRKIIIKDRNGKKYISRTATQSPFHYLCISHLCLLGEAGGYIDAVEATSQDTNNKEVEDEADEVNPTPLFARAIRDFLLDPFFF